ncbi:MAG: hypothetical protein J6I45_06695, partial [Clostridia bacterium]|nr:hypothetical protein [Clostridia bacterium]
LDGSTVEFSSSDAGKVEIKERRHEGVSLVLSTFPMYDITFCITFKLNAASELSFTVEALNDGDMYLEFIEFSGIHLKRNFVCDGGDMKLFWPMTEGCEVENPDLRETSWKRFYPAEYPSRGWQGLYPGCVPMQYMACYNDTEGLYVASHDEKGVYKGIDYFPDEKGVSMIWRVFCAGEPHAYVSLGFPFLITAVDGGWMPSAERYRQFIQCSTLKPIETVKDASLPEWYSDYPIVITYPVRGKKDTGDMTPNALFPYVNVLPIVEKFAKALNVRIMVLLMHWEGTAPWAPPYIWPPFGGEECFAEFVTKLHAGGNLVGLYASGIGWTDTSTLWPEYDMRDVRDESIMAAPPGGAKPFTYICQGPIRIGTDLCGAHPKVKKIVVDEIMKAAMADVDYLQYFDQTIGGEPPMCYSPDHGHPPVPGAWQTDEMKRLCGDVKAALGDRKLIIGCESASAENFLGQLRFNDLRFSCTYEFARPVPAYAYIFHEYIVNFMGNQNGFSGDFASEENPDSMLFRLAYSFTAGDLLTLVIREDGVITWDWGCDWSVKMPDQEKLIKLMASMVDLRRVKAKDYMQYGRMIAPPSYESTGSFTLYRRNGTSLTEPDVLCSAWVAQDGSKAVLFTNYLDKTGSVKIDYEAKEIISSGECTLKDGILTIPPLTVVMIKL